MSFSAPFAVKLKKSGEVMQRRGLQQGRKKIMFILWGEIFMIVRYPFCCFTAQNRSEKPEFPKGKKQWPAQGALGREAMNRVNSSTF